MRGEWKAVIRGERNRREESLETLRTYFPEQIETPEFVDAETYLTQVRAVNNRADFYIDRRRLSAEKEIAQDQAWVFLSGPVEGTLLPSYAYGRPARELDTFFAGNLLGVIGTARSAASYAYHHERSRLLRQHFPGIRLENQTYLLDWARQSPITGQQVQNAWEAVQSLGSYRAACPAFTQLTAEQQTDIVVAFGEEWRELLALINDSAPMLLEQRAALDSTPLAYLPVRALRQAIQDSPEVQPSKICQAFLRMPLNFHNEVSSLRDFAAQKKRITEAMPHAPHLQLARLEAARALTDNQTALRRLLSNPNIRTEVQELAIEQTIALSDSDKPIPRAQFEEIIDQHLELLGRAHFERSLAGGGHKVILYDWEGFNVGAALRGSFEGAMRNLAITRLPLTEAMVRRRFEGGNLALDNLYHLVITAEMKSSGRKAQSVLLPLLLGIRHYKRIHDRVFKATLVEGRTSGQKVVDMLRAEASAIANIVEADARFNAYYGGMLGQGKRS